MVKYVIEFNRDACIGCGACEKACDNWVIQEDGKSKPKKAELDEVGCNKDAADICPVACIKINEKK
ncbi:MAG: ferredoxin [Candidatus Altiarchaeales archaeon]|nr:ferredoxin [Candidatus Altiarchaeales archaeon]MBD3416548.1 ferredoxin [Candidatus Altiarchaeales archaeon]